MSLNWNCGETAAYKEAMAKAEECNSDELNDDFIDLRETLIWATLMTGYPKGSRWEITEENWEVMFERLHIVERVFGAYRFTFTENQTRKPLYITPDDVKSFIGLRTNAGNKSAAEFNKMVMNKLKENARNKMEDY